MFERLGNFIVKRSKRVLILFTLGILLAGGIDLEQHFGSRSAFGDLLGNRAPIDRAPAVDEAHQLVSTGHSQGQSALRVLVPAFVISELKTAFQIGFMVFIPFLIIDMVVASTLMSLGMMMLSPVLVALPFKLMLFVLADGWNLLIGSLAASFSV